MPIKESNIDPDGFVKIFSSLPTISLVAFIVSGTLLRAIDKDILSLRDICKEFSNIKGSEFSGVMMGISFSAFVAFLPFFTFNYCLLPYLVSNAVNFDILHTLQLAALQSCFASIFIWAYFRIFKIKKRIVTTKIIDEDNHEQ